MYDNLISTLKGFNRPVFPLPNLLIIILNYINFNLEFLFVFEYEKVIGRTFHGKLLLRNYSNFCNKYLDVIILTMSQDLIYNIRSRIHLYVVISENNY